MKKRFKFDIDVLGMSASLLCAVHCALVPLVLTFGLLGGLSFLADPVWDVLFIGLSFIIAIAALLNGYLKHHRNIIPINIAIAGFVAIAVGHFAHLGLMSDILSVIGGLLVAYSHLINYRACRVKA